MTESRPKLGELLVAAGAITQFDLVAALQRQADETPPRRIGTILIDDGVLTEEQLARAISQQLGLGYVDLNSLAIDPALMALVPLDLAERHQVIPIGLSEEGELVLAMADPTNVVARDDVRATTRRRVKPVCCTVSDIQEAITIYYVYGGATVAVRGLSDAMSPSGEFLDAITEVRERREAHPALAIPLERGEEGHLDVVDVIFEDALRSGASDVLIEARRSGVGIRFRESGVVREVLFLPKHLQVSLMQRVRGIAGLPEGSTQRLPVTLHTRGGPIDAVATVVSGLDGDRIAFALEPERSAPLGLQELGLPEKAFSMLEDVLSGDGLLIVCGPQGSGVRTTRNALVLYDYGRASSTRRKRLMDIGEIAGHSDAEAAIEAATGGLVVGEVDAPSAAAAVTRLVNLGVDRAAVASALRLVIAQRLVRRSCPECAAEGCGHCRYSGYRGRVGMFQIMPVSDLLRDQIAIQPAERMLVEAARLGGVPTLREVADELVASGGTTTEEVSRVLPEGRRNCGRCGEELFAGWVACPYCGAPAGAPGGEPAEAGTPRAAVTPRVLVVDDDRDVQAALRVILEVEGYEVFPAGSAEEALRAAVRHRPHAVLLDVMLPDGSGTEVCRELRSLATTSLVPILFLTARSDIPTERAGFLAGGDDYLVKPVDTDRLLTRLKARLRDSAVR